MGENPSIYTHDRSRESYSIPRKYLSIGVYHGCVAHDRHAPMSHIRHGIGNRHILTLPLRFHPKFNQYIFKYIPCQPLHTYIRNIILRSNLTNFYLPILYQLSYMMMSYINVFRSIGDTLVACELNRGGII